MDEPLGSPGAKWAMEGGRLQREGCDTVALGRDEIPLLIAPDVSPLVTLDSTRLLARAAVAAALGQGAANWRGGPLR